MNTSDKFIRMMHALDVDYKYSCNKTGVSVTATLNDKQITFNFSKLGDFLGIQEK